MNSSAIGVGLKVYTLDFPKASGKCSIVLDCPSNGGKTGDIWKEPNDPIEGLP